MTRVKSAEDIALVIVSFFVVTIAYLILSHESKVLGGWKAMIYDDPLQFFVVLIIVFLIVIKTIISLLVNCYII